ncbi:MAG: M15 family metallopeptidase [Flavobacteriales bacterium]
MIHNGTIPWLILLLLPMLGCGGSNGSRPEDGRDDGRAASDDAYPRLIAHSTAADTAGMGADLRIIERVLGPLDPGIRNELAVVEVRYFSFRDSTCTEVDKRHRYSGVLLVHRCIADEVQSLFQAMERDTFPIAKVVPINRYGLNPDSTGWDDEASMADNNTSAFNYRGKAHVPETSKHAQGIAIDINPRQNPLVRRTPAGTTVRPPGSRYDPDALGALDRANTTRYLHALGWSWGGRWPRPQDHQHIEKSRGRCAHIRFTME